MPALHTCPLAQGVPALPLPPMPHPGSGAAIRGIRSRVDANAATIDLGPWTGDRARSRAADLAAGTHDPGRAHAAGAAPLRGATMVAIARRVHAAPGAVDLRSRAGVGAGAGVAHLAAAARRASRSHAVHAASQRGSTMYRVGGRNDARPCAVDLRSGTGHRAAPGDAYRPVQARCPRATRVAGAAALGRAAVSGVGGGVDAVPVAVDAVGGTGHDAEARAADEARSACVPTRPAVLDVGLEVHAARAAVGGAERSPSAAGERAGAVRATRPSGARVAARATVVVVGARVDTTRSTLGRPAGAREGALRRGANLPGRALVAARAAVVEVAGRVDAGGAARGERAAGAAFLAASIGRRGVGGGVRPGRRVATARASRREQEREQRQNARRVESGSILHKTSRASRERRHSWMPTAAPCRMSACCIRR